ncbi:hypothetical protein NLI96_g6367 [Meripilus lineatus]|uniref:ATP-dependent DNA helicase CHL1 n=1 Tax=Meripilus lineatus TaxID=2056292 RepID=A0AAD5V1R4_9APHY|nr:hypothetical protein NLI96_g6367 [Physisporinus lineatus]
MGRLAALSATQDQGEELDWVVSQTIARKRRELEVDESEYESRLLKARQKEIALRKKAKARVSKRAKAIPSKEDAIDLDDNAFLPEGNEDPLDETDNISPAVKALMRKYVLRVLHELRKLNIDLSASAVSFHQGSPVDPPPIGGPKRPISTVENEDEEPCGSSARAVSLGSRKHLCINEKLKSRASDLDEACRQMLSGEEIPMLDFRDQVLARPKDIEDLIESGRNAQTCPYFGSRRAIPQAQLVLLPYNLLLHKTARESLGIDLKDQVVIIDEAHNLISTLLSLSTVRLPMRTLSTSLRQLSVYLTKFRNRLSTKNALHLRRLVGILEALSKYAEEWRSQHCKKPSTGTIPTAASVEVLSSGELLSRLGRGAEGVNLLEVEAYLRESRIARKISGYCTKELEKAAGQGITSPPLHSVESFITALSAASEDGRVSFSMLDDQVEIKYQHLNPATYFREVVEVARSVVLAGGTMSPISDVTNQLFSFLPQERLSTFSCGHIIPTANLQSMVLKKGPRGGELLFKFDRRGDQGMTTELGQIILNFANVVPGGMVVFVPSYSFLRQITAAWEADGTLKKLSSKKRVGSFILAEMGPLGLILPEQVFMEPQESSEVEQVLRAKLSEGLNFADDLARAVIIVGLPFANLASPELQERMSYVNRQEQARGVGRPSGVKDAATELYENMCMNAVNQSIGRAIRHRGDWASLVLVDTRYSASRIQNKLPSWIGKNLTVTESFGEAMREMGRFYRDKRPEA